MLSSVNLPGGVQVRLPLSLPLHLPIADVHPGTTAQEARK